jgi:hypothetical protein
MQEIPIEQDAQFIRGSVNKDQSPERAVIFMGGIGYDEQRNLEVGSAIMRLGNYSHTVTIPDAVPSGPSDGTIIHRYPDGSERENLSNNLARMRPRYVSVSCMQKEPDN